MNTRYQFSALPPGWSCSLLPSPNTCGALHLDSAAHPSSHLRSPSQTGLDGFPKEAEPWGPAAGDHGLTTTADSSASWGHLGTSPADCHHCPVLEEAGEGVGQHCGDRELLKNGVTEGAQISQSSLTSLAKHSPVPSGELQEGWRGIPELCPWCGPRKDLEAQWDLSSRQDQTSPSRAAAVPPIFLLAAKLLISLLFSESIEMTILKQLQMC